MTLVKTGYKTLYVGGVVLLALLIPRLFVDHGIPFQLVDAAILTAAVWFGTRIFRGPGEDSSRRPLWRATNRSRASANLATLCIVSLVGNCFWLAPQPSGLSQFAIETPPVGIAVIGIVQSGLLAALYLTSAVRLRKEERRTSVEESQFKPTPVS